MESLQALRASSENTEPTSTSHHTRTRAELPRQLRPFHLGRPQAHRSTQRAQGQTLLKRVYGCRLPCMVRRELALSSLDVLEEHVVHTPVHTQLR